VTWLGRTVVCFAGLLVATAAARAQSLFKRTEPLDVTITTRLGTLLGDRDSTKRVTHPAELTYADSSGALRKVAITLRTRGHFRRQLRNCDFPPLKVEMTKDAAAKTVFEGNRTLKLASSCRPSNSAYEQYILQEAALFRMYQLITPWSYRVRLARVTYRDSAGKATPVTSWAFFIEDDGDLAQRRHAAPFDTRGAYFDDLEPDQWGNLQLFEYMIGNTDWSVANLHNITLLKDTSGVIHPVPYDFDWSGAVNARYAFPDKSLPVRSVRDRLWRGDCRGAEQLAPLFERFALKRPVLDSAYATLDAMTPAVKDGMRKYFADFWTLIANPRNAASEFRRTCAERG